jgi:hypothetical protein
VWKFYALVAAIWIALMPPLFTEGACTAEYEAATKAVAAQGKRLNTSEGALQYWREQSVPVSLVTPEQCRQVKPRFSDRCGTGALVYATVPIQNVVCRVYRDDTIKIQLHYDEKDRLMRFRSDMKPYKSLPIPVAGVVIHWAR